MKRFLILLLAIVLVAVVSVPPAGAAGGRGWGDRGGRGERHEIRGGGGCVGCGLLGGLVLGGILGGMLATPHYVQPQTSVTLIPRTWVTHSRDMGYTSRSGAGTRPTGGRGTAGWRLPGVRASR